MRSSELRRRTYVLFHTFRPPPHPLTLHVPHISGRRSESLFYSHTSRRFHVYFVEWMYNTDYKVYRNEVALMYPTLGLREWFTIIQTASTDFGAHYQTLAPPSVEGPSDKEMWWDRHILTQGWRFDRSYLRPRVKEIVEGLKDGTLRDRLLGANGTGEVAIAEAIFHMGPDLAVFLTVPLRRAQTNRRWKARYGVARYATRLRQG